MTRPRYVYSFGDSAADGSAAMDDKLGAKGAKLADMTLLGLPVPPGFTLSTDLCRAMLDDSGELPEDALEEIDAAVALLEERTGRRLGDPDAPLIVSVRPGAPVVTPGLLESVLDVGLNDACAKGLADSTGNARFAYDCYRRLLQDYSSVCMGMKPGMLEQLLERAKDGEGVYADSELSAEALESLVDIFKRRIFDTTGQLFPQDVREQLLTSITRVFQSWNGRRAVGYRNAQGISHDIGTAVTVQAMVFGNMDDQSATGAAFTRDPNTGGPRFFGEWLPNAQGEDVVTGIRMPLPINAASGAMEGDPTLEETLPEAYAELVRTYQTLEAHYRDMLDIEFTIQQGKLWLLQTRNGKRSPAAEVRIAVDMVSEGLIDQAEAVRRVQTTTLEKILHPRIDPEAERTVIARGLGASPGAATGRVVFTPADAVEWAGRGLPVILVRSETTPDDVHGMLKARGILTARGGMTSHAAVVARGASKTCIVGCTTLHIDVDNRVFVAGDVTVSQGDVITLDGSDGSVMQGEVGTIQPQASDELSQLMGWVDGFASLQVWTNADTARDATIAREFGARGVGLCRTEHMFFDEGRIQTVREMILATDEPGRRQALGRILPMQKGDFAALFRAMDGLPVTIRLLDPPLHEFLPQGERELTALAEAIGEPTAAVEARVRQMREVNPMLGHRGCRLGLTYPEIYEMQVRAALEAACEVARDEGVDVRPEIMIPLVGHVRELELLREVARTTAARVLSEYPGVEVEYTVGTMIELPRACLAADQLARVAEFISFGTNDLTQTVFGISRDDCGRFLPFYVEMGILPHDPFASLDPMVGELLEMAVHRARSANPDIPIGVCGEHGGEPESVRFFHSLGLDYVSCSPFRVPIARLAAAHAALEAGS